jgi:two-component system phosphate regulon sensor histidine kinase PhoR
MKVKKTYYFAFWTSVYFTLFTFFLVFFTAYFVLNQWVNPLYYLLYLIIVFGFTFFIIQHRLEKFIYQRIKKIYNDVSILDSSDLNKTEITSDIEYLSREVQKFAEFKQLQINNLNQRENYRREFMGNIAHELKTPLFTVQGYLLTLSDGAINNKDIRLKYILRANKGVDRLLAIVKDLDLISRLESDDLNLDKQPFNIVKLIQEVFEMLEIRAKKRNITLSLDKIYDFPIMVIADEERIEQVLINLLVNSIKYGKIGGASIVSIELTSANKFLVKVRDNGEGIPRKYQSRVFERFYRVDKSRSREQGGSGLGLSIVKHIIEAHNEQIFLKSNYRKGSEFSFTIEKLE